MTASAEADLVRRIIAGDSRAEEDLVQRYSRGVAIIIRREAGNSAVVDDLHQETFRIVLQKIRQGDVREPEKLSGFIASLARNLVIGHFRRTSREQSLDDEGGGLNVPVQAPTQFGQLQQKELAAIVRRVIDEMKSERDRQVLFRMYIAEDEKKKICLDLGLSSLHFNRVLFRARERFKELYEQIVKR
jgi:RNA polymerase sigma-70 factor (ECF subfamily)